jgi:hypothetical protein
VLLLETIPYRSARLRHKILGLDYDLDEFVYGRDRAGSGIVYRTVMVVQPPPPPEQQRPSCFIVPMGQAVQYIATQYPDDTLCTAGSYHDDDDDMHPSPHATWRQVCLLVAFATQRAPPVWEEYNDDDGTSDHDDDATSSSSNNKSKSSNYIIGVVWQSRARQRQEFFLLLRFYFYGHDDTHCLPASIFMPRRARSVVYHCHWTILREDTPSPT